ncbi:MAG: hypothetical protein Q9195_002181 [Heterodermia aff. obscurata]
MEDRKRGQRLFGALLGTLSQSSSSTAQKRRTDIERKQQAKLKLQADEFDEKKKQRLDAIMKVRRLEQKKYFKQSYYKPWEHLPGDEDRIKAQVEEAEQLIARENSQYEIDNAPDHQRDRESESKDQNELDKSASNPSETVGPSTNEEKGVNSPTDRGKANTDVPMELETDVKTNTQPETAKEQGDDGGEMVEGEEDTVIY